MTAVNLSFAACGFLGIYHLGAVEAFLRHGDKLLASLRACAGTSAGALVAAVMLTAPDKVKHCKDFTYKLATNVRQQRFGAVTPGYNVLLKLREGIEEMLPADAHILASDRLHVSLTHFKSGKNHIVSEFKSREDLIKALLASSCVPIYAGFQPVDFRGQKWIDGGFTDSLPILPFSVENIKRLNQALFPPSTCRMQSLCQEGFDDAMRFLNREGWISSRIE
ncbi:patatin-like phospholipase domain-containing protein 4 isoform X3 [Nerophis lumbriciformis]|uniref:patatin-like phospholipase domain-containing protein 4 isoform X3 n=1 Tax=Nerophis lumbriciformis TaxID=546530 RepID=UPI002AE072B1|nr:patatin-like phospholipase domain-containing protein 4 isoform X3 [Nerophis lumbriciformis]